jgi:hypothetical protein
MHRQPASPPKQRVPQVSPMPKITPVLKNFGGGKPKDQAVAEVKCKFTRTIETEQL